MGFVEHLTQLISLILLVIQLITGFKDLGLPKFQEGEIRLSKSNKASPQALDLSNLLCVSVLFALILLFSYSGPNAVTNDFFIILGSFISFIFIFLLFYQAWKINKIESYVIRIGFLVLIVSVLSPNGPVFGNLEALDSNYLFGLYISTLSISVIIYSTLSKHVSIPFLDAIKSFKYTFSIIMYCIILVTPLWIGSAWILNNIQESKWSTKLEPEALVVFSEWDQLNDLEGKELVYALLNESVLQQIYIDSLYYNDDFTSKAYSSVRDGLDDKQTKLIKSLDDRMKIVYPELNLNQSDTMKVVDVLGASAEERYRYSAQYRYLFGYRFLNPKGKLPAIIEQHSTYFGELNPPLNKDKKIKEFVDHNNYAHPMLREALKDTSKESELWSIISIMYPRDIYQNIDIDTVLDVTNYPNEELYNAEQDYLESFELDFSYLLEGLSAIDQLDLNSRIALSLLLINDPNPKHSISLIAKNLNINKSVWLSLERVNRDQILISIKEHVESGNIDISKDEFLKFANSIKEVDKYIRYQSDLDQTTFFENRDNLNTLNWDAPNEDLEIHEETGILLTNLVKPQTKTVLEKVPTACWNEYFDEFSAAITFWDSAPIFMKRTNNGWDIRLRPENVSKKNVQRVISTYNLIQDNSQKERILLLMGYNLFDKPNNMISDYQSQVEVLTIGNVSYFQSLPGINKYISNLIVILIISPQLLMTFVLGYYIKSALIRRDYIYSAISDINNRLPEEKAKFEEKIVGRDHSLEYIKEFSRRGWSTIGIVGRRGIGKTRILQEIYSNNPKIAYRVWIDTPTSVTQSQLIADILDRFAKSVETKIGEYYGAKPKNIRELEQVLVTKAGFIFLISFLSSWTIFIMLQLSSSVSHNLLVFLSKFLLMLTGTGAALYLVVRELLKLQPTVLTKWLERQEESNFASSQCYQRALDIQNAIQKKSKVAETRLPNWLRIISALYLILICFGSFISGMSAILDEYEYLSGIILILLSVACGVLIHKLIRPKKIDVYQINNESIPSLVSEFRSFSSFVIQGMNNGAIGSIDRFDYPVVICIDELDKIVEAKELKLFLTKIKSILEIEGLYYYMSVSEDAYSLIYSGPAEGKTEIDSTFDHIYKVKSLSIDNIQNIVIDYYDKDIVQNLDNKVLHLIASNYKEIFSDEKLFINMNTQVWKAIKQMTSKARNPDEHEMIYLEANREIRLFIEDNSIMPDKLLNHIGKEKSKMELSPKRTRLLYLKNVFDKHKIVNYNESVLVLPKKKVIRVLSCLSFGVIRDAFRRVDEYIAFSKTSYDKNLMSDSLQQYISWYKTIMLDAYKFKENDLFELDNNLRKSSHEVLTEYTGYILKSDKPENFMKMDPKTLKNVLHLLIIVMLEVVYSSHELSESEWEDLTEELFNLGYDLPVGFAEEQMIIFGNLSEKYLSRNS